MTQFRTSATDRLAAEHLTVGYDKAIISQDLSISIPDESFTAVIGPNGCGKSTLLRAVARVLTPRQGRVVLDGKGLSQYRTKELARQLGLLPQTSLAPDGIRVADLVARGRAPYQGIIQQWRATDEEAVHQALKATRLTELSGRLVDELSGGQRQRVWVAMLLAQQTPIMLLDEPTTFLDIAHQYELMELLRGFHEAGKTIVTVLHDLNQAARYADHLIVMHDGQVITTGSPQEVITAELIDDVFGLRSIVVPDPVTGTPSVVPLDPRQESLKPKEPQQTFAEKLNRTPNNHRRAVYDNPHTEEVHRTESDRRAAAELPGQNRPQRFARGPDRGDQPTVPANRPHRRGAGRGLSVCALRLQ